MLDSTKTRLPYSNDRFELTRAAVVYIICKTCLEQHGDEGLDLQDLRGLLHHEAIVLEGQLQELPPLKRRVRARHRHDLRLLCHQVVHAVRLALHRKMRTGRQKHEVRYRVRARHRHHPCLLARQIVHAVCLALQQKYGSCRPMPSQNWKPMIMRFSCLRCQWTAHAL